MSSLYYLNESTVQLMYLVKTHITEDYYVEERPQSHMPEAADKGLAQKMPSRVCKFSQLTKHGSKVKGFQKTVK